jgi:hypothetical protein
MLKLKNLAFVIAAAALCGIVYMSVGNVRLQPDLQAAAQQKPAGPMVEVFKTPTCGCCQNWVEHLRKSGFNVRTTDLNDLSEIKKSRGVPEQVQSCHTAVVGGYVVEGHVPASDIQRMLTEKPAIAGIAVGGMPTGSPGMDFPGVKAQPYNVMSFDKNGATRVFAKH